MVNHREYFAFPDLTRAFRDGEFFGDSTMRVIEVDQLLVPTGRIAASDPMNLLFSRQPGCTRSVPPGRYPVLLALLSDPGWGPGTLKSGYHFGYGVDAGMGCLPLASYLQPSPTVGRPIMRHHGRVNSLWTSDSASPSFCLTKPAR